MSTEEKKRDLLVTLSTVYRLGSEGSETDLAELADEILADHGLSGEAAPEPDAWRVVHKDPDWEHPYPNEHASRKDADAEALEIFGAEFEEWKWDGGLEREEPEPERDDYRVVPVWIGTAPLLSEEKDESPPGNRMIMAIARGLSSAAGWPKGDLIPFLADANQIFQDGAGDSRLVSSSGEMERTPEEPKRPLPILNPEEKESGPRALVAAAAIALLFVALALALWFLA